MRPRHAVAASNALEAVNRVHAALCGGRRWGLAGKNQDTSDISPGQKAELIRKKFIETWSSVLKIDGFDFECTDEETMYLTNARDAIYIHTAVKQILVGACTMFVDAFASVGGDTLAAMHLFRDAQIHAIQPSFQGDNGRFRRLKNNIQKFAERLISPPKTVTPHNTEIKEYLNSLRDSSAISILFLDPPWTLPANVRDNAALLDHGRVEFDNEDVKYTSEDPDDGMWILNDEQIHRYNTPTQMLAFLNENVFQPLLTKKIFPDVIVLKLPGFPTSPDIKSFISSLSPASYLLVQHLLPRKKYAVFIFKKN